MEELTTVLVLITGFLVILVFVWTWIAFRIALFATRNITINVRILQRRTDEPER